jgi:malate dehydrogenase (oxaloacetate-decarboxylating)
MTSTPEEPSAIHPPTRHFDIRNDGEGGVVDCYLRGPAVLRDPMLNRGTAFSRDERAALGIDGLLPDRVSTLEEQIARAYAAYRRQPDPISKHAFLRALQERQEILYFALIGAHIEEVLPIIYTPTVGDAVQRAGLFYESTRGLSFSPNSIRRARHIVTQHAYRDVRLIVATDSSAILGIGDQGAGGTEIAIGKLAIYTAAGGVAPYHTLPATLDVGTDRIALREDPLYVGADLPRLRGPAYLDFMDRFVDATWERWPRALIQWEDLARDAAFAVLERFRDRGPTFNDDIQGTGAVVLAGVLTHCRRNGLEFTDQRFVIHGAGAGGLGVAWAIRTGLERAGLDASEARRRVLVIDSRGLLVRGVGLEHVKEDFAQDPADVTWAAVERPGLLDTVQGFSPTVLIGLSGIGGAFDEEVVGAVASSCEAPLVMPLSNPTSLAEAIPADVLRWTQGKATVATGSPFDPVEVGGRNIDIGQGNNAFIFPGLGHGAVIADARVISDGLIIAAAEALSTFTLANPEWETRIFPPITAIRDAARAVAVAVVEAAVDEGVARATIEDATRAVDAAIWTPEYLPIRAATRETGQGAPE